MKKLAIAGVLLLVSTSVVVVLWTVFDWPPPRLILRYGLPPQGGPTGRTTVIAGLEFAEIRGGYCLVRRLVYEQEGDLLGRLVQPFGLSIGDPSVRSDSYRNGWIEIRTSFWLLTTRVSGTDLYWTFEKVWPMCVEQSLVLLSELAPGRFRQPTLDELYFAADSGAPGFTQWDTAMVEIGRKDSHRSNEVALIGRNWRYFQGTDGEMRSVLKLIPFPQYRSRLRPSRPPGLRSFGARLECLFDGEADRGERIVPRESYRIVWIPPEETE